MRVCVCEEVSYLTLLSYSHLIFACVRVHVCVCVCDVCEEVSYFDVAVIQPFTVQCEISNRTDRALAARLVLVKSKMIGIMVAGVSGQHLGLIAPSTSKIIPITLFPLKLGVQKVNGLQIAEMQSDRKYDFDNITSVMVVSANDVLTAMN